MKINRKLLYVPFWVWIIKARRNVEFKTLETFSFIAETFNISKENSDTTPPSQQQYPQYTKLYNSVITLGIMLLIVNIILFALWIEELPLWFQIACLLFSFFLGPIGGVVSLLLLILYHEGVISN
tara:strand:+ start:5360 stop:5734 length:375 start_codon:yes stop_codon:yes gene_type:complete